MIPAWLEIAGTTYLVIAFASACFLVVELFRRPQPMAVMNAVWPITALYLGPIAVWWYWTLARGRPKLPFWKTIIIEATHCGAGCVLGDVIAEWTIFLRRITLGGSPLLAEYAGDFERLSPLEPAYWFLMQIGMSIGYATSYPANWFLVRQGIKEPM